MTKTPDPMRIWDAVERTDPKHTKKVNQRGGFTAIDAHYQVMNMTAQFGPVGEGWGYINGEPIFHETIVFVPVTVWHGSRENFYGPIYGGAEWRSNKGYLDTDAIKKASTDGLTKAISHLGFNADVFLGKFDDNKYVADMAQQFAGPAPYIGQLAKMREDIATATSKLELDEVLVTYAEAIAEAEAAKDPLVKTTQSEWVKRMKLINEQITENA